MHRLPTYLSVCRTLLLILSSKWRWMNCNNLISINLFVLLKKFFSHVVERGRVQFLFPSKPMFIGEGSSEKGGGKPQFGLGSRRNGIVGFHFFSVEVPFFFRFFFFFPPNHHHFLPNTIPAPKNKLIKGKKTDLRTKRPHQYERLLM